MQDEPEEDLREPEDLLSPPAVRSKGTPALPGGALPPAFRSAPPTASLTSRPRARSENGIGGERLAIWEKLGITGSGIAVMAVAFLLPHIAVPLAVAGLFVGSGMVIVGLGFRRPLHAFRFGKGGFAAEAAVVNESIDIAKDAEALARSQLGIVRSWTQDQQRVLGFIAQSTDAAETTRRVADFMRSRLTDLTEMLAESDESVRASVWLMSSYTGRLQFALGSEIEDPGKTFAPGEGFMGRAFAENEIKNIPDAPRRPEYAFPEANEPFHGLLCIPLNQGSPPSIGVLCIDRSNARIFPSSSVDLGATLAALLVGVLLAPPVYPAPP